MSQALPIVGKVLLTTFADPIYTVPAGEEQSLSIRVCNFGAAATNVTYWAVPPGQNLGDQWIRAPKFPLPANQRESTADLDNALPVPPGTKIYAAAGAANSVSVSIAGVKNAL